MGRFATRYKLQLGLVNTLMLACIIWMSLSGAQVRLCTAGGGSSACGRHTASPPAACRWGSVGLR